MQELATTTGKTDFATYAKDYYRKIMVSSDAPYCTPIGETLEALFWNQIEFQKLVLAQRGEDIAVLPVDRVDWFQYHVCAMVEEMGETMKADKRWKTHRNVRYEKAEKLDELADVFITAMNMAIYSDFDGKQIAEAVSAKIKENTEKLKGEAQ